MHAWPRAVSGGALAALLALALGAGARAGAAWVWVGDYTKQAAAGGVSAGVPGSGAPGGGVSGSHPGTAASPLPLPDSRAATNSTRKKIAPLAPAPRGRVFIDVLDTRSASGPGDPARVFAEGPRRGSLRLLSLPAGAGLPDLLAAVGLPADLPVAGAPARGSALPTGLRLVVEKDGPAHLEAMPAVRRLRLGLPLDLNTASVDDLARLPGIGPGLAARIVEDRARRGPFPGSDALLRVRGIGPVRLARVRGQVTVDAWPPGMGPAGQPGPEGRGQPLRQ